MDLTLNIFTVNLPALCCIQPCAKSHHTAASTSTGGGHGVRCSFPKHYFAVLLHFPQPGCRPRLSRRRAARGYCDAEVPVTAPQH